MINLLFFVHSCTNYFRKRSKVQLCTTIESPSGPLFAPGPPAGWPPPYRPPRPPSAARGPGTSRSESQRWPGRQKRPWEKCKKGCFFKREIGMYTGHDIKKIRFKPVAELHLALRDLDHAEQAPPRPLPKPGPRLPLPPHLQSTTVTQVSSLAMSFREEGTSLPPPSFSFTSFNASQIGLGS